MIPSPDCSLLRFNTFHIEAMAKHLLVVTEEEDVFPAKQWAQARNLPLVILGGGSNVLLTGDINGLVLLNRLKGIQVIRETGSDVWVSFASGEIWHECVLYALKNNWGGIENLALIPGTIGAAPIQNIGAYGVELAEVLAEVEVLDLEDGSRRVIKNEECAFGYRDSIFKQQARGRYFILSVTLCLKKQPILNVSYGQLRDELDKKFRAPYTIQMVAEVVMDIRRSKLPDPAQVGNAGSFFKNPVVDEGLFSQWQKEFPGMPYYQNGNQYKVPAAWLIEQCGWKGYRDGDYGVHPKQALCLVNYKQSSGKDIYQLSEQIIDSVRKRFNICLEREVNVW
ncbi:MAG TPA: UDP-N-acetylmuramate dehydrogenase [Chitinophagaceae bacterium]|nr:UDP-N-acetylmuramate dehydrogenase [Chitinophagaceae bacterium]